MQELAIKIRIYDRQYPMKVAAKDEAHVRKAANLINKKIKDYSDQFELLDSQDLLAMVAFDAAVDALAVQNNLAVEKEKIDHTFEDILQIIEKMQ